MKGLFVYSAAKFKIDSQIEFLAKGRSIEVIEPGEPLLGPGVYRIGDSVGITRVGAVTGNATQSEIVPVPNEKSPWPDPSLSERVNSRLGVTRAELVDFFGGSDERTEV